LFAAAQPFSYTIEVSNQAEYREVHAARTFKPPTTSVSLTAIVDFAHIHHDRPVMRAANGFVFAASVAILLVHFYGYGVAGCDRAFARYAFGAAGIAADIVGAHALFGSQYVELQ
jgi:hypothetical protein